MAKLVAESKRDNRGSDREGEEAKEGEGVKEGSDWGGGGLWWCF